MNAARFPLPTTPVRALLACCLGLLLWIGSAAQAFAQPPSSPAPQSLDVPGSAPAWYFRPRNRSRTVIVWMHGRGGNPHDDCIKWSRVATEFGYLLCPSGQEDAGGGARSWNNHWPGAQRVIDNAMEALRNKFPTIHRNGHVLIGFSEGAYAAQNIGVREPRVFNRWLILASAARYWGGEGLEVLKQNHSAIKRVYLLTGAQDTPVLEESREAYEVLKKNKVHVRLRIVHDMGHEVPASRMRELYLRPLTWLVHNR